MPARRGWFGTAPLPVRVMPLGMRLANWASEARGTLGVIAGIALGCGLTYLARGYLQSPNLDGIKATPTATKPPECAPKSATANSPTSVAHAAVSSNADHRAIAAARETDLVKAVARSLSRPDPATQTVHLPLDRNR